jgi:hypothetical protein
LKFVGYKANEPLGSRHEETLRTVSRGAAAVSESLGSLTTGGSVKASSTSEKCIGAFELNILE